MVDGAARAALIEAMAAACIAAGAAIMRVYETDFAVETKADASPVTEADAAAEAIILAALAQAAPGVPIVAEEEMAAGRCPDTDGLFFLVDPLDGTKEFVERRGDFTVNIALIEAHRPTLGVVFVPAGRRIFVGDVVANQAWQAETVGDVIGARTMMRTRVAPSGIVAVASRSHGSAGTEAYLAQFEVAERISRGSSLKLCLVAAGEADVYPRLAPTMEWDIAAGDAVLRAAGGCLFDADGNAMRYGKPEFRNEAFVASGGMPVSPARPYLTI